MGGAVEQLAAGPAVPPKRLLNNGARFSPQRNYRERKSSSLGWQSQPTLPSGRLRVRLHTPYPTHSHIRAVCRMTDTRVMRGKISLQVWLPVRRA